MADEDKDAAESQPELPSSIELVPDTASPEEDQEEGEIAVSALRLPPALETIRERLDHSGLAPKVVHIGLRPHDYYLLEFDLPAGRSSRRVRIDADSAAIADDVDLAAWRSLERYDAIWSQVHGSVEGVVRGDRLSPPSRWMETVSWTRRRSVDR